MKRLLQFGWAVLLMLAISTESPAQTPQNLVAGTGALTASFANWAGSSAINLISGNTLFPISSKQTVLYLGFTGGSGADISGMVLYKTNRNSFEIVGVTPVTLSGSQSPIIDFSQAGCPPPVSTLNPCFIRLDPLSLKLSPLHDYYFVMFFPNDVTNTDLVGADSIHSSTTVHGGKDGNDDTLLKKGDILPSGIINKDFALFLVGVMSN